MTESSPLSLNVAFDENGTSAHAICGRAGQNCQRDADTDRSVNFITVVVHHIFMAGQRRNRSAAEGRYHEVTVVGFAVQHGRLQEIYVETTSGEAHACR